MIPSRWTIMLGMRLGAASLCYGVGTAGEALFSRLLPSAAAPESLPPLPLSPEPSEDSGPLSWDTPEADADYSQGVSALSPPPLFPSSPTQQEPHEFGLGAKPLSRSPTPTETPEKKPEPGTPASPKAAAPWENHVWEVPLTSFKFPNEADLLKAFEQKKSGAMDEAIRQLLTHAKGDYNKRDQLYLSKICASKMPEYLSQDFVLNPTTVRCLHWHFLEQRKVLRNLSDKESDSQNDALASVKVSPRELKEISKKWQKNQKKPTQSDWNELNKVDYKSAALILKIKDLSEGLPLFSYARESLKSCSATGASVELFREMEPFLPDPVVWKELGSLYTALNRCLKATAPESAFIHGRMGLLLIQNQMVPEAKVALEASLASGEHGEDDARIQFWRGYLEALPELQNQRTAKSNKWWNTLVDTNPMTLHALVAEHLMGVQSFDKLKARSTPKVKILDQKSWSLGNTAQAILLLASVKNDNRALRWFTETYEKDLVPESFEQGLMLALTYLKTAHIRLSIAKIFDSIQMYGSEKVDAEVLSLMYPTLFKEQVLRHSGKTDPTLVFSLIRQESSFHPKAKSHAGAMGLMQVMPATAKQIARKKDINLFEPAQNVMIGSRYLAKMLERFDDSYVMTIASYNAGPTPVERWRMRFLGAQPLLFADLIPYPETRHYVSILLRNMHWYGEILNHRQEPWFLKLVEPNGKRPTENEATLAAVAGNAERNPLQALKQAEGDKMAYPNRRPAWTVADMLPDPKKMSGLRN